MVVLKMWGDKIRGAKSKIASHASGIERREDSAEVDISDEVHERLEELGYA